MSDTRTKSLYTDFNFLRYLSGFTASGLASWGLIFIMGISVVHGQLTASALGISLALRTVGFLLGVLLGGVFADRFSRRKVIMVCSFIALSGIVLILFGYSSSIWFVYFGCIITGAGQGACRPAFQAYTPLVVEKSMLESANASLSLSVRSAVLFGPALVNIIVVALNSQAAYYSLIIMWLICAFVTPWSEKDTSEYNHIDKSQGNNKDENQDKNLDSDNANKNIQRSSVKSIISRTVNDWLEGLEEAKKHPWFLYGLVTLTIIISMGFSATNVLLPVVAKQSGSLELMTQAITAYTVGAIICALVINRINFAPPRPRGWIALFGAGLYGFAPLSLLMPEVIWLPLLGFFLGGVGMELNSVIWFSSVQREVPKSHLARVSSLDFLCSYGLAPLGLIFIAPMSDIIGLNTMLVVCALACFIAPIIAMTEKSSRYYSVER